MTEPIGIEEPTPDLGGRARLDVIAERMDNVDTT